MRTWWIDRENNIAYEPCTDGVEDYTEVVELAAYRELEAERTRITHGWQQTSIDCGKRIAELEHRLAKEVAYNEAQVAIKNDALERAREHAFHTQDLLATQVLRIAEQEAESAKLKHDWLGFDNEADYKRRIEELEAKLKSVLPCFCKQIK